DRAHSGVGMIGARKERVRTPTRSIWEGIDEWEPASGSTRVSPWKRRWPSLHATRGPGTRQGTVHRSGKAVPLTAGERACDGLPLPRRPGAQAGREALERADRGAAKRDRSGPEHANAAARLALQVLVEPGDRFLLGPVAGLVIDAVVLDPFDGHELLDPRGPL